MIVNMGRIFKYISTWIGFKPPSLKLDPTSLTEVIANHHRSQRSDPCPWRYNTYWSCKPGSAEPMSEDYRSQKIGRYLSYQCSNMFEVCSQINPYGEIGDSEMQKPSFNIADMINKDELNRLVEFANSPMTLDEKLASWDRQVQEVNTPHPVTKRIVKRSILGTYALEAFTKGQFKLPNCASMHTQIKAALQHGRTYLKDNPEVSIFYALSAGISIAFREWKALVSDMTEEEVNRIMTVKRERYQQKKVVPVTPQT